jgi:hypothetical protein
MKSGSLPGLTRQCGFGSFRPKSSQTVHETLIFRALPGLYPVPIRPLQSLTGLLIVWHGVWYESADWEASVARLTTAECEKLVRRP